MKLEAGARLGPYEIIAPLGAGGMGEVWRAKDTRLDRIVAVKILPGQFAEDAQFRARFEREARAISQLNHPHVCTLYDVGDGYLVMELLDGQSLADRIARGPLPLQEVIKFGGQIADALEAAHRHGIVHRDLKPGNVMLTKSGAKLLDFGLARTAAPIEVSFEEETRQQPLTREGTILGTFQYMAPEQLEGLSADHRADIFAFGSLLYEMLTGKRAFQGASKTSLIAAIVAGQPRAIHELQPLTPETLDRIILRCLAKQPDDRWQSASDVKYALELVNANPPPSNTGRSRARSAAAIAGALALVAAIIAVTLWRRGPVVHGTTRTYIMAPRGQTLADLFYGMSISPDGKWVTFYVNGPDERLWIRAIDSLEARPIAGTESGRFPFWSPDSSKIAFFTDDRLKTVGLTGTPPTSLCAVQPSARSGGWNAAGDIIFSPDSISPLDRVSSSGGAAVPLTKLDAARRETTHRWAVFLPDGRHFLFLAGTHQQGSESELNSVYVSSLDSPLQRKLVVQARSNVAYSCGFLLFVRGRVLVAQHFNLRTFSLDGDVKNLAENVEYEPSVFRGTFDASANGTLLYKSSPHDNARELTWIDTTGRESKAFPEGAALTAVSLSPDGTMAGALVLDPRTQFPLVWIFDLVHHVRRRLTSKPEAFELSPVWSSDGKRLAFARAEDVGLGSGVFIIDSDGSSERQLPAPRAENRLSAWSPDGSVLLGNRRAITANGAIEAGSTPWIYPISFSDKPHQLINFSPANQWARTFSPDGKWVLFGATQTGGTETFAIRYPGGDHRVQVTSAGAPMAWIKDRIYFSDTGGRIMAVPVTSTSETLVVGDPVETLNVSDKRLLAMTTIDGKRFLAISSKEEASDQAIAVVFNFPELAASR
jgi:Tol biopolymer transport system component